MTAPGEREALAFVGEIGQPFNREPEAADPERIARLSAILYGELARAEG